MSSTDCAIEARQLVKTYAVHGDKHGIRALDGLDLSVPRGMIYGLLRPDRSRQEHHRQDPHLAGPAGRRGSARVAGIDVLAQPGRVRHVIGVVAQRSGADPTATARENLILQGRAVRAAWRFGTGPRGRTARSLRADRGGEAPGQDILRRHAAPGWMSRSA